MSHCNSSVLRFDKSWKSMSLMFFCTSWNFYLRFLDTAVHTVREIAVVLSFLLLSTFQTPDLSTLSSLKVNCVDDSHLYKLSTARSDFFSVETLSLQCLQMPFDFCCGA